MVETGIPVYGKTDRDRRRHSRRHSRSIAVSAFFTNFLSPIVVATRRQPIIVPIPSANATAIMIHTGAYRLTYRFSFFSRRWSLLRQ